MSGVGGITQLATLAAGGRDPIAGIGGAGVGGAVVSSLSSVALNTALLAFGPLGGILGILLQFVGKTPRAPINPLIDLLNFQRLVDQGLGDSPEAREFERTFEARQRGTFREREVVREAESRGLALNREPIVLPGTQTLLRAGRLTQRGLPPEEQAFVVADLAKPALLAVVDLPAEGLNAIKRQQAVFPPMATARQVLASIDINPDLQSVSDASNPFRAQLLAQLPPVDTSDFVAPADIARFVFAAEEAAAERGRLGIATETRISSLRRLNPSIMTPGTRLRLVEAPETPRPSAVVDIQRARAPAPDPFSPPIALEAPTFTPALVPSSPVPVAEQVIPLEPASQVVSTDLDDTASRSATGHPAARALRRARRTAKQERAMAVGLFETLGSALGSVATSVAGGLSEGLGALVASKIAPGGGSPTAPVVLPGGAFSTPFGVQPAVQAAAGFPTFGFPTGGAPFVGGAPMALSGRRMAAPVLQGQPAFVDIPGFDITAQGTASLTSPFRVSATGRQTAQPFVATRASGAAEWFIPAGKPKTWTKATVKRARTCRPR